MDIFKIMVKTAGLLIGIKEQIFNLSAKAKR